MTNYKNSRISSEKKLKNSKIPLKSKGKSEEITKISTNNSKFSPYSKDSKSIYNSNNAPPTKKIKKTIGYKIINTINEINNKIEEFSSVEEDSVWNNIPKPLNIDEASVNNNMKTSDLKKNTKNDNEEGKNSILNKKYVTDLEASKFVDNILQQRLNNNK